MWSVIAVLLLLLLLCMICGGQTQKQNNALQFYKDVFSKADFDELKTRLHHIRLHTDPRTNERISTGISYQKKPEIYDLVYKYFPNAENPPSFPMEYRKYPTGSKGMKMHQDLAMYDTTDYYEAVLTIENTSDSEFVYYDHDGHLQSTWVAPNSVVLVKPNTVVHGVSPVSTGTRTILKFIVGANCRGKENRAYAKELQHVNELTK